MSARLPVAVIGRGAIGGVVARELLAGAVPGARLVGVVCRRPRPGPDVIDDALPLLEAEEAIERAALVVECAGHEAVATLGPAALAVGKDLMVVSTGALTDDAVWTSLTGPAATGRVYLCGGAIGGLDLLAAAARMSRPPAVSITTTKRADSLVQPWMSKTEAARLRTATEPVRVLHGPARTVAAAFPTTTNVAASVALAVRDWDVVTATVIGDPAATRSCHVITAECAAGDYRFEVRNHPSPARRTSSAVVPYAVLASIAALTGTGPVFR